MKACAFLLLLCLAGYASTDYAWKVGNTYTYAVRGRVFTGLSKQTQYSGLQVEYELLVTPVGPNTVNLKPQNFRANEVNSQIEGGWRDGILQNETPAQINGQLKDYLESPIEMTMRQGVVDSIKVDGHLPTWAVNIKKAQASHFVLDSAGVNVVINGNLNRKTNSVGPDQANQESGFFYETMEQTVHGECETYYTVSQNGPFDAPFQYQKQAQPVQNDESNSQEDNDAPSQEQNQSESNENSNENGNKNKNNNKKYNNYENYQQYAAYKQMAQQMDSGSAEDSNETNQGELPWPKAFNTYCNQGDQIYEIVKSVNFTACRNKPVLAYSTSAGLSERPGDNSLGSLWQRSVNTRFIACGRSRKQYTILNVVQDEQTNYGLNLQQRALAATVQNLTLTDISRASGQPEQVQNPKQIHDLTYTFDPKEQNLQRQGRLQHAFSGFDNAEENDSDSDSNESQQQQETTNQPRQFYSQYNNKNQNEQDQDSQQQSDEDQQQNQYNNGNYGNNKYSKQYQNNQQQKSRKPRSAQYQYNNNQYEDQDDSSSSSQESSEESQEQQQQQNQQPGNARSYYHTEAEDRQFLKKPSMTNPPLNPMLISGLQEEGMKKRVSALMQEIVADIQNTQQSFAETETISKITTVARILRRLPYSDNEQLFHKHAYITQTEEDQISRNVFLDALAMAGNNQNIKLLLDEIQKKEIQGEEAAQLFMVFPLYIRTPTQALARAFYELVDSDALDYSEQVKTTAILAFSKFLHQAYVNTRIRNSRYPVQVYGQFGDAKYVQRQFVPFFVQNLENHLEKAEPQDKHYIVTYLNALGNLGVPEVVPQVQRILDESIDPYIKTQAVFALKGLLVSRQAENIPAEGQQSVDRNSQDHLTDKFIENQVLPVLVSAAFDRGEFPSTRMAAISLLLYTTNADVNIWQQLAYSTWFASSQEVHSFIYTSLQNLAQVQGPLNANLWPLVKKARQVLSLAKPIAAGYAKSSNSFSSAFADHLQSGFAQQFQYFGAKDSNIPQYMYYRNFIQSGNGGSQFSPLEVSAHGHTIQKLVDYFIEQVQQQDQPNLQEGHPEFLAIRQALGIEKREQDEDIEGSIQFTIRNEMQRIFSFNEQKIQQYIKQFKNQFYRQLQNGYPFNYQKTIQAVEHNVEMPSSLGIPMSFSFSLPVHVSARGTVKYVQEQNGKDQQFVADIHAVYAWKSHTRVAYKSAFTGKQYQAGVQRHMVAEAPFRAAVRYGSQGQVVVAFSPAQLQKGSPSGEIDFVTYHQRPYTIIITDNLWPATHKEGGQMQVIRDQQQQQEQQQSGNQQQTPYKRSQSFGQQFFGLQLTLEEESDYRPESERSSQWAKLVRSFHTPSCFFNLGWAGSQQFKYVERKFSLNVQNSQTKTLAFIYGSKSNRNAQYRALWQDSSSQSSQSSEESESSESQQDSSSQQQESTETRYGKQQARAPRNQGQAQNNKNNNNNDSNDSDSAEDQQQGGQVYAFAFIGKTNAIRSAQDVKSIQKVLDTSKQSTFQYLFQYSQSAGRSYARAASGDAANEAAAALPQNSASLQAVSQAVRGAANAKSQPDGCAEFEGEYNLPEAYQRYQLLVLRQQLLAEELSVNVKAELQFGQTCRHMPHEIKAVGKLRRGPQMTQYAQSQSRQAQKCKEDEDKGFAASQVCIEVAEQQAAALNQGQFKVQFSSQLPEEFRNATYNAEDFAKALFYPYMSHDRTHQGAGAGQAQFNFRVTPDQQFLNVEIIKPNSRLTFEDVKTNKYAQAFLPFTATQSVQQNVADRLFRADSQPSCTMQGNYINTFDNVTYRFSSQAAEGCQHVFAQDCSGQYPVAVLVKDIAADQNQVTIYLGQQTKIQLTPNGQQQQQKSAFQNNQQNVQVHINGQRAENLPRAVRDEKTGEPIVYIEQTQDGGVQVFSEHFDVATNGQYVAVYASNALRNQTCGLCGDFNGEKTAEMKSPRNCPLSSGSALVASYAFQSQEKNDRSQCQVQHDLKQQIQQEEQQCLADEAYFSNNPQKYSGQQNQYYNQNQQQQFFKNNQQQGQQQFSGNCKEQVQQQAQQVVYEVINNFLKPTFWDSEKRQKYAQQVAQKVGQQAERFLEEGTAQKIANAAAEASCQGMQLIPAGASTAKYACKGAQPLLRKAIRHAVNPICQKSQCCAPSYYTASQMQEVENEISYALADSAESEETDIPYVDNGSQSKMNCQKMLQKYLEGALPKQVFFQLQENQNQNQLSSRKATSLAEGFKIRIPKAVQRTFQQGNQLADNLVKAVDEAFGQQYKQQAQQQHQAIRQNAKKAIDEFNEATNGKCNFQKHNQA